MTKSVPRNHSCQAVLLLHPPNQLNPPDSQVGPNNGKTISLVIRRQDGRNLLENEPSRSECYLVG